MDLLLFATLALTSANHVYVTNKIRFDLDIELTRNYVCQLHKDLFEVLYQQVKTKRLVKVFLCYIYTDPHHRRLLRGGRL
jgi:hypothetical protein